MGGRIAYPPRPREVAMVMLLLALLTFVLLIPSPAVAAMDCRGTTPLLPDLRLTPPDASVSPANAPFAGAWSGAWLDDKGDEGVCTALVVEQLYADGYARVVYSISGAGRIG